VANQVAGRVDTDLTRPLVQTDRYSALHKSFSATLSLRWPQAGRRLGRALFVSLLTAAVKMVLGNIEKLHIVLS
jgi:hypothetical protein